MASDRLEHVISTLDPQKRAFVRKLLVGAFVVPAITSFAVKDLAHATIGSPGTTVCDSCDDVDNPITDFCTIDGNPT